MALLTTAELLAHVSSDLATASLQRLLDDSEADIIKFFGPHSASSSQVETLIGEGRSIVFVTKSVSAVNQIIETVGIKSKTETSIQRSLQFIAKEDKNAIIFICGSLYLCGEVLNLN